MTKFEKSLIVAGQTIVTWEHDIIVDYLLQIFKRDYAELLLEAAIDTTKRRELIFILNYSDINNAVNFGGTIHYNKKKRKFTHITYSDKYNWAVMFSVESRVTFFARDYYQSIKHKFPLGYSLKKLGRYLISN